MNTSLIIKSVEQGTGRQLQKSITDVNPNADGTALKTWAQGLNNLTTNTYSGTTKVNVDNLTEEDSGSGSGKVNPLPAPTIVFGVPQKGAAGNTAFQALEVADAAAEWTGKTQYIAVFGFATDSTGNLNVTDTPANAAASVAKCTTAELFVENLAGNMQTPALITDIQNATYWVVTCSLPEHSSADCLGAFTCVLNATDTHSSVSITVNITGIDS